MAVAYIALGSNLEYAQRSCAGLLRQAMLSLDKLGALVGASSLYETEPVGLTDQPNFLNAVAAVETELSAMEVLDELMRLERHFGRNRLTGIANGPRSMDLDLLMLDQLVLHTDRLTLPHPRMQERRFVLEPLVEIAPDLQHPVLQKTMRELLAELPHHRHNHPGAVRRIP